MSAKTISNATSVDNVSGCNGVDGQLLRFPIGLKRSASFLVNNVASF